MHRNVAKDRGESADLQRIMRWDRSQYGSRLLPEQVPTGRGAASCGDHLIFHKVQANQLWRRAWIEMTLSGIANTLMQFSYGLGLSEDRLTDSARRVAALGRLFHDKNNLGHPVAPAAPYYVRK